MADQDRRVRRTRRALHEALIELVLEKGYERITVQDILDRADVGRSTFYAHYRDKDALLVSGFDEMQEELRGELDAMAPGLPTTDPARPAEIIFGHAFRHQRVYQAMGGRQGGNMVFQHLHRMISDLLRDYLRPHLASGADLPAEVVAESFTSSALGLLAWWIDQGFPHDHTWLARMHEKTAIPGLLIALGSHELVAVDPATTRGSPPPQPS